MSSIDTTANRVEQYDGGDVLYLAIDPDGVWARSEFPDDLVTVDYDDDDNVIGIEVIGKLAQDARDALRHSFDPTPVSETITKAFSGRGS